MYDPGFKTLCGYKEFEAKEEFYSPGLNKLRYQTQFPRPLEQLPTLHMPNNSIKFIGHKYVCKEDIKTMEHNQWMYFMENSR